MRLDVRRAGYLQEAVSAAGFVGMLDAVAAAADPQLLLVKLGADATLPRDALPLSASALVERTPATHSTRARWTAGGHSV